MCIDILLGMHLPEKDSRLTLVIRILTQETHRQSMSDSISDKKQDRESDNRWILITLSVNQ